MDKKNTSIRSGHTPIKGISSDSKKGQDVTNSKPWPRCGSRKREPANGSFQQKSESSRKPTPQQKVFDKRPRPRGQYYCNGRALAGDEETGLTETTESELGYMFVRGAKKQSLNHLLNFHYTPRDGSLGFGQRSSGVPQHTWFGTQRHKYNKEHFLQANCQFVVRSDGDYKQYLNNPDTLVEWDLVEQIHVQGSEFPTCPICLYEPVAAKMTRCGHIYCWSCILHYLALSDKTWRKCPICYEAIHKKDLKSVVAKPFNNFNVGDAITMWLMKRERGSNLAIPVNQNPVLDSDILRMNETNLNTVYSKLLLADREDVMTVIKREKDELTAQLLEEENSPQKCFVEQAMELLQERETIVTKRNTEVKITPTENEVNIPEILNDVENDVPTKIFYFYQASDGQHIYLHNLNVHMLEYVYGSLENCPPILSGKIVEKENGSMTEEIRKRLRYLQHLPVTCQFEVAEIQLNPPVVTKETLNHFQEQLDIRRRRRQRIARDERKREKKISEEENRMMGRYPTPHIRIESERHFPQFQGTSEPLSTSPGTSTPRSLSPDVDSVFSGLTLESSSPSFANMVSTSKPIQPKWPDLSKPSNSKRQEPPPKLISVTGSGSSGTKFKASKVHHSDEEPDPEGYIPAPVFNQSFSDAIALALEQAAMEGPVSAEVKGGKKKKKQKKILFATTMACNSK